LIIAEDGSGPPEAIDVLRAANVDFVTVPDGFNRAAVVGKITAVADALGMSEAGDKLAQDVDAKLQKAEDAAADVSTPKRVLFILSMQGGRILASGANTAADGIITMAGGVNAMTEFDGYKPLTDEAVSAIAPDVILMMARGGDHALDDSDLFEHPALIVTPAAKTQSIIRMDGLLLLGFGPRTAEAVEGLSHALYPEG
jgi:iron complex transport system substrate-binding protein